MDAVSWFFVWWMILFVVVFPLIQNYRFRKRIRRQSRFIPWGQAKARVEGNNGYLIVNLSNIPGRVWWVSEECDFVQPIPYILSSSALLTNCPYHFRVVKKLRRQFPDERIIVSRESAFSSYSRR